MKRVLIGFVSLFAVASASIGLAAPGHGGGHAHSAVGNAGDPAKVSRTIEVVMNDQMRFLPDKVTVKPGETIRFVVKNVGELKHEMMLGTKKELMDHAKVMQQHPGMEHDDDNAVTVQPGKTGELVWQFTRAGTFMFGCLMPGHVEAGMVGSISVRR
jgi:uncharacterized cupredoxin-like copper-binding protein